MWEFLLKAMLVMTFAPVAFGLVMMLVGGVLALVDTVFGK